MEKKSESLPRITLSWSAKLAVASDELLRLVEDLPYEEATADFRQAMDRLLGTVLLLPGTLHVDLLEVGGRGDPLNLYTALCVNGMLPDRQVETNSAVIAGTDPVETISFNGIKLIRNRE